MKKQETILLVEDDIVDQMTVKRALKDINITNPLKISNNGEEALEFLRDEKNELPGIILLDLNMPRMNGVEFLKIAKRDSRIKSIPVVVLTTSKDDQDRINTFNLGVAGYMIKPVDYKQFSAAVAHIGISSVIVDNPEKK